MNILLLEILKKVSCFSEKLLSLSEFLSDPVKTGIIAEFKRKSPSKGVINSEADVGEVTQGYSRAGASGLSILTDMKFFGGSCDDLIRARELNTIPILRKDFIIDEYQVIESKAAGADAILLIAAVSGGGIRFSACNSVTFLGMEVFLKFTLRVNLK